MAGIAARAKWLFGTQEAFTLGSVSTPLRGGANNVLGSTGAGTAFNTHGWGLNYTFYVENTDSAMSYQIRVAPTSSGPWAVVSSGSMTSTSQTDIVQLPGPLHWLSPRVDAMASTANRVTIHMEATE